MNLYVVKTKNQRYIKVGVSKYPDLRLGQLQAACPYALELVDVVVFPCSCTARTEEKKLHKALRRFNVHGEWFRLTGAASRIIFEFTGIYTGISSTIDCDACGQSFDEAVWHCHSCGEHWPLSISHCTSIDCEDKEFSDA